MLCRRFTYIHTDGDTPTFIWVLIGFCVLLVMYVVIKELWHWRVKRHFYVRIREISTREYVVEHLELKEGRWEDHLEWTHLNELPSHKEAVAFANEWRNYQLAKLKPKKEKIWYIR